MRLFTGSSHDRSRLVTENLCLQGNPHVMNERTIAVALHGIEPATFERCAADPRLAGGPRRRPRHAAGDPGPRPPPRRRALAGDGELAGRAPRRRRLDRPARLPARLPAPRPAPAHPQARGVLGLDVDETRRAVHAGWRVMKLAGSSRTASSPRPMRTRRAATGAATAVHLVGGSAARAPRRRRARRGRGELLARRPAASRPTGFSRRVLSPPLVRAGACSRPPRCGSTCTPPTCATPAI